MKNRMSFKWFLSVCLVASSLISVSGAVSVASSPIWSTIYCYHTVYEGIYRSLDGEYAITYNTEGDSPLYVPVEKVDVSLIGDYSSQIDQFNLPTEVLSALEELSMKAETNDAAPLVTLFIPEESSNNGTFAISDPGYIYYDYNGVSMRDYLLYSYSLDSGFQTIEQGSAVKEVAKALYTIIVAGLGSNSYVSIISTGISLYQNYLNILGSSYIVGSTSDYIQMAVTFDCAQKFTYAKIGEVWKFGLCSQEVTVKQVDTRTYFYNPTLREGAVQNSTNTASVKKQSLHFDFPYEAAYNYIQAGSYNVEYASWECNNKIYQFTTG